jgi:cobalt/nickel transport system permease protein
MPHDFLDRYVTLDSLIHRLDPRTKLITTFAFLLAVSLTPFEHALAFALYGGLILAVIFLSRLPLLFVIKRSLVIVPFVLLIAVFNLFFKGDEVMGGFDLGGWHISIFREGFEIFLSIMVKAFLSILGLIVLSATTPLPDLLIGLERLGLPRVMVMILSFMYRYLFVLVEEVGRLRQARDSRNFGGGRRHQLRSIGNMIGTLFIRSYERAERVYAAMLARGFEGRVKASSRLRLRPADVHFGAIFSSAVIAIALYPY